MAWPFFAFVRLVGALVVRVLILFGGGTLFVILFCVCGGFAFSGLLCVRVCWVCLVCFVACLCCVARAPLLFSCLGSWRSCPSRSRVGRTGGGVRALRYWLPASSLRCCACCVPRVLFHVTCLFRGGRHHLAAFIPFRLLVFWCSACVCFSCRCWGTHQSLALTARIWLGVLGHARAHFCFLSGWAVLACALCVVFCRPRQTAAQKIQAGF